MNQTASNPYAAMASHSAEGTEDRSIFFPYFRLSSETQVLLSYKERYQGQTDTPNKAVAPSAMAVVISDFSSVAAPRRGTFNLRSHGRRLGSATALVEVTGGNISFSCILAPPTPVPSDGLRKGEDRDKPGPLWGN
jgi:hypothetical protein